MARKSSFAGGGRSGGSAARRRRQETARSIALALLAILILIFGYQQGWLGAGGEAARYAAEPGEVVEAEVTRVVDGDTVIVAIDGVEERLRYIGVDTPESVAPGRPVECYGPEASDYNTRMVEGRTVDLEIGAEPRDHYDRLLGYVRLGDLFVNAELLRSGYATTLTIPPNDRFADRFSALEREARRAGLGKWSACR